MLSSSLFNKNNLRSVHRLPWDVARERKGITIKCNLSIVISNFGNLNMLLVSEIMIAGMCFWGWNFAHGI